MIIDFFKNVYKMGIPHNGTETSKNAAKKVKPLSLRIRAYQLLDQSGGMTNNELAKALGIPLSSACARCRELQLKGVVFDSGIRRLTKHKRKAIVWSVK